MSSPPWPRTYLDMQHSKLSVFFYSTEVLTNRGKQIPLITFLLRWVFLHHLLQRSPHCFGSTASSSWQVPSLCPWRLLWGPTCSDEPRQERQPHSWTSAAGTVMPTAAERTAREGLGFKRRKSSSSQTLYSGTQVKDSMVNVSIKANIAKLLDLVG